MLEQRARALSRQLRCLVCQNQSIDDSDADLAHDLRQLVRERLVAGDSDAEIIAFLTARYGDFVLLKPPVEPATWGLWFGPLALLRCPRCGGPSRPHVLWFDEMYDEERYRFQSSLQAAGRARVLVVVGSTASTNLPVQVAERAARAGAQLIDINVEDNGFGELARRSGGRVLRGPAGQLLPDLVDELSGSARRT